MIVKNHRLLNDDGTGIREQASPNHSGMIDPKYLVMHFTAGRSLESSVSWFMNPDAQASAHLVIGRDGTIVQMVPFNEKAWHAGQSRWKNIVGLNSHSIGIELDNAGKLTRVGENMWKSWFGGTYSDEEVIQATHKNESTACGWHQFTEAQINAALEASIALVNAYGLVDVLGHDDIAPTRKTDPGPAFPMASFRSKLIGRNDVEEIPEVWQTTTSLNIRTGPGTINTEIPGSPLPMGTQVDVLEESGSWRRVDVLETINGISDMEGWVHGRYLTMK